jgi:hypothetical protein
MILYWLWYDSLVKSLCPVVNSSQGTNQQSEHATFSVATKCQKRYETCIQVNSALFSTPIRQI